MVSQIQIVVESALEREAKGKVGECIIPGSKQRLKQQQHKRGRELLMSD